MSLCVMFNRTNLMVLDHSDQSIVANSLSIGKAFCCYIFILYYYRV